MRTQALCLILATPLAAAEFNGGFNRDIRPILSERCYACHGPDAGNRKANFRVDQPPASPKILERVTSKNKTLRMPPAYLGHDALPEREVTLLKQWFDAGAPYQQHWSLIAPKRESGQTIDSLVRSKLATRGWQPSPRADRRTLIRRVTLDLTGLPPTPAEVEAFVTGGDYAKLVDRLLASPRYAERMAIRWLEAARYADTNGYQTDGPRDMWRWRDWVIQAFARNLPFDQFTIEQLAGDLLPNATLDQQIATGFQRNHRTTAEGGIVDEEFRVEYVADRAETTSTVWLGLTLGCARCHDHKYDPLTQKDFYSLFAYYNNIPGEKGFVWNFGNEPPVVKAPTPDQAAELARLDAKEQAAHSRWLAIEKGELPQAVARWNPAPGVDFAPSAAVIREAVTREPAAQNNFDGQRFIDLGKEIAKFNYRDAFTLAARFRSDLPDGAILTRAEDYWEGTGYGIYLVDGKLRFHHVFRWTDLGLRVETKQPVDYKQWRHVAVTYDGGMKAAGVHLYVDGVEQELNVLFDQHLWPIDHKAPLKIGAGAGKTFTGAIRDVRVYARALDPVEVRALRVDGKPDPEVKRMVFIDAHLPAAWQAVRKQWLDAKAARDKFHEGIPTVMVMREGPAKQAYLLKRGAYDAPGDPVNPRVPSVLAASIKPDSSSNRLGNRLGLARWLVSRENPLTARVTVNRYWQMLFGTGLVKTVEDFGSQGEWPLQMELLDWLAVEFMESGWDVKRLLKTIVTSETYQQAAMHNAEDPENRWLARGPRTRLAPEMVRDQALAVSGLLVERLGGPSVKPYQPPGLWNELHGGKEYVADTGEGLYRRSLYTYWKRTVAPPSLMNFDSPSREVCTVRESRTNTPLQALNLMNDVTYVEAARKLAERMLATPDPLGFGFVSLTARMPEAGERAALEKALARFQARYQADAASAEKLLKSGESPRSAKWPAAELAAYASVASLLLNLDEAVTKP